MIPEILRHLVTHLVTRAYEGRVRGDALAAAPIFPGLLAFSSVTAWDAFTQEIEVSAWGLTERRGGVVVATFPWADVARIEFVVYLDAYQ